MRRSYVIGTRVAARLPNVTRPMRSSTRPRMKSPISSLATVKRLRGRKSSAAMLPEASRAMTMSMPKRSWPPAAPRAAAAPWRRSTAAAPAPRARTEGPRCGRATPRGGGDERERGEAEGADARAAVAHEERDRARARAARARSQRGCAKRVMGEPPDGGPKAAPLPALSPAGGEGIKAARSASSSLSPGGGELGRGAASEPRAAATASTGAREHLPDARAASRRNLLGRHFCMSPTGGFFHDTILLGEPRHHLGAW